MASKIDAATARNRVTSLLKVCSFRLFEKTLGTEKKTGFTVFPHIVSAETIFFLNLDF